MTPQVGNNTNKEATFWNRSSYQPAVRESYDENGDILPYLLSSNRYDEIIAGLENNGNNLQAKYDELQEHKEELLTYNSIIENAIKGWKKLKDSAIEQYQEAQKHYARLFNDGTKQNINNLPDYKKSEAMEYQIIMSTSLSNKDYAEKGGLAERFKEIRCDAESQSDCFAQLGLCSQMNKNNNLIGLAELYKSMC